jgi:hypothetical protein
LRGSAGVDQCAELLEEAEVVAVVPDLGDLAVLEAEDVDARKGAPAAGRLDRAQRPLWVPVAVQRATTNSSSASMISTSKRRSGKAARKSAVIRFCPSGPGAARAARRS